MKLSLEKTGGPSDSELLIASGKGDADAFRVLYRRISASLYSVAYRVVGNAADAEELTQETFMELWKNAPDYDSNRAQPLTYAARIIRNRSIDRLRKKSRREEILHDSSGDILSSSHADADREAPESAHFNEASGAIKAAFQKLNPDQRETLELAYFSGLSQSEIAERLSEALGTVKSRIRRGLEKLRKELGASYE